MGQTVCRKFTSDGLAHNLILGFIPAYARVINANAAVDEVMIMEYFNLMGDAQEVWHYPVNDQGTTTAVSIVKKASAGYISKYDTGVIGGARVSCTFDDTGGTAVDLITCTNTGQVPVNHDKIKLVASGGLPTNLGERLNYYVIDSETYGVGTFRISLTKGGAAIDFGSDGTPANYFINLSKQAPSVTGGKGITIAATFMSDSDVIFVLAIEGDTDKDIGDVALL